MSNGDPLPLPAATNAQKFDQFVRAICVCVLLAGFVFAFCMGIFMKTPTISSDTYSTVLGIALMWWFKSRDEDKRRADLQPPPGTVTTTTTPPPASVTTTTVPAPAEQAKEVTP